MDKMGLYPKYHITKMDGTPIDLNAKYFVLRLDNDSTARHAAIVYATLCGGTPGEELLALTTKIEKEVAANYMPEVQL